MRNALEFEITAQPAAANFGSSSRAISASSAAKMIFGSSPSQSSGTFGCTFIAAMVRRQRSVQLPLAGLSIRLARAAVARRKPRNLKPGVIVQKLNESLTDHAGRAKNTNPSPFHSLLRITRHVRLRHGMAAKPTF